MNKNNKINKKSFTDVEIHEFNQFYKSVAIDFLNDNNLILKDRHDHIEVFDKQNSTQRDYLNDSQIDSFLSQNIYDKKLKIYWKGAAQKFIKKLYFNSSDTVKSIIRNKKLFLISLEDISIALKEDPYELMKLITESKTIHNEFQESYKLYPTVKCWKENLSQDQFNAAIVDYFNYYKNEFKKIKSCINAQYVLDTYVDDKETFNKLKTILPEPLKNEVDIFKKDVCVYEVQVDKSKLYQYIKLRSIDTYSSMYNILINLLNEPHNLKNFNIIKVVKDEKNLSSKTFNFLVKTNLNSNCTNTHFEKILLALFKGFEDLMKNETNEYNVKKLMSEEWIRKVVLEKTLVKNESTKPNKTIKI